MASTAVPTGTAASGSTRGAWLLASAQFAYALWFGVCVWVALARAARFAGHVYIPHEGDRYTADVDVFGSSGFRTPLMATAEPWPFVAVAGIGASAWLLAQKRVRARRFLFATLLASAVLLLATFVLGSIPPGRAIAGWILD